MGVVVSLLLSSQGVCDGPRKAGGGWIFLSLQESNIDLIEGRAMAVTVVGRMCSFLAVHA